MAVPGKILRRMTFLRDQDGIMNRRLQEGEAWNQHLEHCKTFISSAFREMPAERKDTVAVLGSGWLLDVPLENLLENFREVWLVDIHHPPQIRKKVERLEGIRLLEADLSGGAIQKVWEFTKNKRQSLEVFVRDLELEPPLAQKPPSTCISLNLLNQLDILLCDFLQKKGYSEPESIQRLREKIQGFHLDWMLRKPGCLITDIRERNTGRDGKRSDTTLVHVPLPGGSRKQEWNWDFDLSGKYRPGWVTQMEVMAVEWA